MKTQYDFRDRIQVTPNFHLDEFVDPVTYITRADRGMSLMDERVFAIVQFLRDIYGKPIAINNWWGMRDQYYNDALKFLFLCESKKRSVWSGYRSPISHVGAPTGAHYRGLAADPKGPQHEYFKIVKAHAREFYALGLRRLEDPKITPGWLHVDTWERNTQPNSIRVVDLTKATEIIKF